MPPAADPETPKPVTVGDIRVRLLDAAESDRLGEAVRAVYGETYPVLWAYDADEVARRISNGLLISAIAETSDGELLCHSGLVLADPDDAVGHAGQALTLPAARGQHIFTTVKRYLVEWVTSRGLVGMYSEATAAHPYSQRAILDLGGHETGSSSGSSPSRSTTACLRRTPAGSRRHSSISACGREWTGRSTHRSVIGGSCRTRLMCAIFVQRWPKPRTRRNFPRVRTSMSRRDPATTWLS